MAGKEYSEEIIEINLDNEDIVFTENQIIHKGEIDYVKNLILHNLKGLERKKDKDSAYSDMYPSTFYKTILVSGIRGSGKTSFLKSLICSCGEDKHNTFADLKILPYLDPTLIEEKAHIFLTVVELIKECVDTYFEKHFDAQRDEYSILGRQKDWRGCLEKFSRGLPVADGVSDKKPDYWDDASQIMCKGLEDVNAAFYLRKHFHTFVEESLSILGKKAFLLVIDDVDTDFKKAFPVLEMLRKYLCTDKIITIVSGDFKLFSYAVRKQQWNNFGAALLKNEYDKPSNGNSKDYEIQVNELENQYLKKVFPVENRVALSSLYELIKAKKEITVVFTNEGKETGGTEKNLKKITEFYNDVFERYGILNPNQRSAYTQFIETLPLRTQIQFMKTAVSNNKDRNKEIVNTFITELYSHNVNTNLLVTNKIYVPIITIRFLIENNYLFDYYQLEPISDNETINACLTTFSLLLSNSIKENSLLMFSYIIRIGYVRNFVLYFGAKENDGRKNYSLKDLARHTSLYNDNDLHQINCYLTSYMRSVISNDSKSFAGILVLPGFAKNAHRSKEVETKLFDFVVSGMQNHVLKRIACLPLSVSYSEKKAATVNEYSFFTLLASIHDILNEYNQNEDEEQRSASLAKSIEKISQIRKYPMIDTSYGNYVSQDEEDSIFVINDNDIDTDSEEWKVFYDIYTAWYDTYCKDITVSSYVLGKICTRAITAFDDIVKARKNKTLGAVMHFFVCAFFNACIIEEMQDVDPKGKTNITRDNVISDERNIKKNLENVVYLLKNGSLPATKFFVTCPFLLVFLDAQSEIWKYIRDITANNIETIKGLCLFAELNKILVQKLINQKDESKLPFSLENKEQIIEILTENNLVNNFLTKDESNIREDLANYFSVPKKATPEFKKVLENIRTELNKKGSF